MDDDEDLLSQVENALGIDSDSLSQVALDFINFYKIFIF